MNQDGKTRQVEDKAPPPQEPAGDEEPAPGRREVKVESDDRTLEEAGYGYGV